MEVAVSVQVSLLQRVLGLRIVAQRSASDAEQPAIVTAHQLLESHLIAGRRAPNQIGVGFACQCGCGCAHDPLAVPSSFDCRYLACSRCATKAGRTLTSRSLSS